MALRPARSLLHPYVTEQLPPYTPRQSAPTDPETSSIHSNAPSYVSAAPSYHSGPYPSNNNRGGSGESSAALSTTNSTRRSNAYSSSSSSSASLSSPSGLLSSQQYAPGFGGPVSRSSTQTDRGSVTNNLTRSHLNSLYNISEWVPVAGGLQTRHYHNVAKRRVSEASQGDQLARVMFPPLFQGPAADSSSPSRSIGEAEPGPSFVRTSSPINIGGSRDGGHPQRRSSSSLLGSLHEESVVRPRSQSPQQSVPPNTTTGTDAQQPMSSAELLPISPHEDPDLVGEAAAAMFRSQRLYITYQQQENHVVESQTISPITGRPYQQQPPAGRVHHYTSLIAPAGVATISSPPPEPHHAHAHAQSRPSTAPNGSSSISHPEYRPTSSSSQGQGQVPEAVPSSASASTAALRHRSAPTTAAADAELDDEALCAQESKTWDFMLAQMADWEERERSWKRFKEEMDKKIRPGRLGLGLGLGMGWGFGSGSMGGGSGDAGGDGNGGGRKGGKLRKIRLGYGHEKKWKRRVGLVG
ncbi:hypothetical protein FQN50_009654 [Emmonsiellopsis sp. PD_5]|nr:hypothetical protein FQN50_009654 [Emmonsiellopsis sp. PD_5]